MTAPPDGQAELFRDLLEQLTSVGCIPSEGSTFPFPEDDLSATIQYDNAFEQIRALDELRTGWDSANNFLRNGLLQDAIGVIEGIASDHPTPLLHKLLHSLHASIAQRALRSAIDHLKAALDPVSPNVDCASDIESETNSNQVVYTWEPGRDLNQNADADPSELETQANHALNESRNAPEPEKSRLIERAESLLYEAISAGAETPVYQRYMTLLCNRNKLSDAQALIESAENTWNVTVSMYQSYARILRNRALYEEAREGLSRGLQRYPENTELLRDLAHVLVLCATPNALAEATALYHRMIQSNLITTDDRRYKLFQLLSEHAQAIHSFDFLRTAKMRRVDISERKNLKGIVDLVLDPGKALIKFGLDGYCLVRCYSPE